MVTGLRVRNHKEAAAQNLVNLLIEKSGLQRGAKVLDVGCGVGGTSIYLAREWACDVTGITISPVQVKMATESASGLPHAPHFMVMDANDITLDGPFDVVWSVEMISHLRERDNLFKRADDLLKPGGRFVIADWWKDEGLSAEQERKYIQPIEEGMLVSLPTLREYMGYIETHGFRVLYFEDISARVSRTWDITSESIKPRAIWDFATKNGRELISFLHSFSAMRAGFRSGTFRYPVMVLEKR